jgi:hypothetical protein
LVGDRLRPTDARVDQERVACQPVFADSRIAEERRRIDRPLFRAAGAGQESNWVPTDPARKFELMARFYAPRKEFFEKKWILPDVEKML